MYYVLVMDYNKLFQLVPLLKRENFKIQNDVETEYSKLLDKLDQICTGVEKKIFINCETESDILYTVIMQNNLSFLHKILPAFFSYLRCVNMVPDDHSFIIDKYLWDFVMGVSKTQFKL